jgi:predicted lipid-binding transport protein (Tim44 family)
MIRFRSVFAMLALAGALALIAAEADARAGGGGSVGSRGARTWSAPPATRTAPDTAAPINRSVTQPAQPSNTVGRAAGTSPVGGLLNRPGFLGGLLTGFLGAGLLGLLFGNGLFGGLGGLASILGFILQIILVVVVARLVWSWWQRRNAPAFAGPVPRQIADGYDRPRPAGGGAAPGVTSPGLQGGVSIAPADYDAFERLLGEIQLAYGDEDLAALRRRVTPEMLSYFADDLAKNASRGVVNRLADVKLTQGDLAEAWREGDVEYATVAMTYSLVDRTVERDSGRVVDGGDAPVVVTELWTFMRHRGGDWLLAAIQQA